jgi:hypothetical protein
VLPGVVAEWLNAAVLKGDPTPSHSVQLSLPRPLYPFTTCTAVRFSPAKWANPWLTRHSTVLAARFDQTWLEDSELLGRHYHDPRRPLSEVLPAPGHPGTNHRCIAALEHLLRLCQCEYDGPVEDERELLPR